MFNKNKENIVKVEYKNILKKVHMNESKFF